MPEIILTLGFKGNQDFFVTLGYSPFLLVFSELNMVTFSQIEGDR